MITEVCGATHCGNATNLHFYSREQHGTARHSKGVTQHYTENHISGQHERPWCSRPHDIGSA